MDNEQMMRWTRTENSISILTPAKLNLFLEVLGKRDDGFHDLQTVMIPIDRFDRLVMTRNTNGAISLQTRWDDELLDSPDFEKCFGALPPENENLVYRAAKLFCSRCQIGEGLEIELVKTIPSQAGLGGASGNAAGTLRALNELFEMGLSQTTLCQWSAELGSDIPFFMGEGTALCEGRGERVCPMPRPTQLEIVVVKPDFGMSTPEIFSWLKLESEKRKLPDGLEDAEEFDWTGQLFNRLQKAAEKIAPQISQICRDLEELGCRSTMMTGSGSCCFGICDTQVQAAEIAGNYSSANSGFVFTCRNL